MKNRTIKIIRKVLSSNKFFILILVFFGIESALIALTAAYPQAFDENFHFGIIKVYSHYISPYLTSQPPNANAYGALARDPSFLFQYLMSWPYRLIEIFVKTQIYQIVILRFIDIAFFAGGLYFFRKVLLKFKISKALANLTILLFILIPIVPQLAGQINYDDLLFLLVPLNVLLSFRIIDELKNKKANFVTIGGLLILATLTSLVKYAFLPIYLAIVIILIYQVFKNFKKLRIFFKSLLNSFVKTNLILKIVLILFIILSLGTIAQRDGYNLVRYHAIAPSCSKILSHKECSSYSVWKANFERHQEVVKGKAVPSTNIVFYLGQWLYWMWYRLFFAINGPAQEFKNYPPLPLPSAIGAILGLYGIFILIRYIKKILKNDDYAQLLFLISLIYIIALIIQGYVTYKYTAVLENMNGRYLIPMLILLLALVLKGSYYLFKSKPFLKTILALVVLVLFLQGGGALTYIIRSDDSWYIHSKKVIKITKIAKKITKKVIVKGKKTYNSKVWFFN